MPLNLDAFKSSLIYQTADTVNSIRLDVAELRKLDKYKESKQAKWTWLGCMGLLAVFITGIGSIFLPLLLPLLAVAGVVTVVSFVIRSIHKRLNYENRRYELLDKVLGLIGKDAAKDEKLDVRLDLRPAEHKDKFVRQGQVGVWKVKYYEDPWLELEGRLLDGTRFRLTMIEKCQARSCWKRGRSGKSKYKSKKKSAAESALLLRFKPGRYAAMERIGSELAGAVQLPPGVDLKSVAAEPGSLLLKAALKGEWAVKESKAGEVTCVDGVKLVALMFLSLYQALNLARRVSHPG